MKMTTRWQEMLQAGPMIVALFILNAVRAKIATAVNFPAGHMASAGTAAEPGFPDVGLLTRPEEEYAQKLRAALDACTAPDVASIACGDAVPSWDEGTRSGGATPQVLWAVRESVRTLAGGKSRWQRY